MEMCSKVKRWHQIEPTLFVNVRLFSLVIKVKPVGQIRCNSSWDDVHKYCEVSDTLILKL